MSGLLEVLNPYPSVLLLILRLVTGGLLAVHGYRKVSGGRVHSEELMTRMGMTPIVADLVTLLELVGGIFLVVGLLTPLAGLLFALEFGGIILMKKTKMHSKLIDPEPGKTSYETEVLFVLLSLVFLFMGAGAYSLDHLIGL
jgi:putative oxidoreductase